MLTDILKLIFSSVDFSEPFVWKYTSICKRWKRLIEEMIGFVHEVKPIVKVEFNLRLEDNVNGHLLEIKGIPQIQLTKMIANNAIGNNVSYTYIIPRMSEFIRKIYIKEPNSFRCAKWTLGSITQSQTVIKKRDVQVFKHPDVNTSPESRSGDTLCSSLVTMIDPRFNRLTHRCYTGYDTLENLFEIPIFEKDILIPSSLSFYCLLLEIEYDTPSPEPQIYVENVFICEDERTMLFNSTFSQDIESNRKLVCNNGFLSDAPYELRIINT